LKLVQFVAVIDPPHRAKPGEQRERPLREEVAEPQIRANRASCRRGNGAQGEGRAGEQDAGANPSRDARGQVDVSRLEDGRASLGSMCRACTGGAAWARRGGDRRGGNKGAAVSERRTMSGRPGGIRSLFVVIFGLSILRLDRGSLDAGTAIPGRASIPCALILGSSPFGAKTDRGSTCTVIHVMVRLDRTISFPKPVLTGLFGLMVRSSRTRTKQGSTRG
jgi:hypothetical protein